MISGDIEGLLYALVSEDLGQTWVRKTAGGFMDQVRAVCGLGPDRGVVLGTVFGPGGPSESQRVYQWYGPSSGGIFGGGDQFFACDTFQDPNGSTRALALGQGSTGLEFLWGIAQDNPRGNLLFTDPPHQGYFFDLDCEYAPSLAVSTPVCRAAAADQQGRGEIIQLDLTGITLTTHTLLTSTLPFRSVSFWDVFGAALGQDDRVYVTEDRGSTWSNWPSPTGSIPRRVVVVPPRTNFDDYPRVVVLADNGVWFRELVSPRDVAVTKEGPALVAAGGEVTYTLMITNASAVASNVTVKDTVSADHGVVRSSPPIRVRTGQSSFWNFDLGPQESRTISYTVLLTDTLQAGDLVTNRAEVTAIGDVNLTNNTAVVTATVFGFGGGFPDVQASKAGPRTVVAGQPFTYTLMAVNVGSEKATNVSLVDVLPAQVRFLGADIPPTLFLTPTLRWAGDLWPGSMLFPGEATRISVRVELSGTVAAGTVLTNTLNGTFQVTSTVASVAPAPSPLPPVSSTIGALGGTLVSPDGSSVIVVPRRTFSSPLTLSYESQTPPAPSSDSIPVAAFSLSGTLGSTPVETLDRPITVEVKYSDAGMTEDQERRLRLYRKTAAGAFLGLSTQVDTVNNIARAAIDHLSDFVLQALTRKEIYLPIAVRQWSGGW